MAGVQYCIDCSIDINGNLTSNASDYGMTASLNSDTKAVYIYTDISQEEEQVEFNGAPTTTTITVNGQEENNTTIDVVTSGTTIHYTPKNYINVHIYDNNGQYCMIAHTVGVVAGEYVIAFDATYCAGTTMHVYITHFTSSDGRAIMHSPVIDNYSIDLSNKFVIGNFNPSKWNGNKQNHYPLEVDKDGYYIYIPPEGIEVDGGELVQE
jgi:hypothetical protein